jgi:hypothetical protein
MFDLTRLLNVLSSRGGATADFQRMLAWKLLRGSHEFPGPDGGTCIKRGGHRRRGLSLSSDLPGEGSAGVVLAPDCAVRVMLE